MGARVALGARSFGLSVLIFANLLFPSRLALAQTAFVQVGPPLAAADAIGYASQGQSVALSADGNTAIVGGPNDNSGSGAAWVYSRSNGTWVEEAKFAGT